MSKYSSSSSLPLAAPPDGAAGAVGGATAWGAGASAVAVVVVVVVVVDAATGAAVAADAVAGDGAAVAAAVAVAVAGTTVAEAGAGAGAAADAAAEVPAVAEPMLAVASTRMPQMIRVEEVSAPAVVALSAPAPGIVSSSSEARHSQVSPCPRRSC